MLNYGFAASIALALAGSCGGLLWFTQQKIRYGDESGLYLVDMTKLPEPDTDPVAVGRRFWLVNANGGLLALDVKCPRHNCLAKWSSSNHRFECPCCGGKYELDGTFIEGPATRGMDQYPITVTTEHDRHTTRADGSPVAFEGATSIVVNVNLTLPGKPRFRNSLGL
jgi:nitrite reductase/ring-hydroxylating ferredoxin subunit